MHETEVPVLIVGAGSCGLSASAFFSHTPNAAWELQAALSTILTRRAPVAA